MALLRGFRPAPKNAAPPFGFGKRDGTALEPAVASFNDADPKQG
jgi:hypothetical protein